MKQNQSNQKLTNRRTFIARSSLLLAGLGLAPSLRVELVDRWAKKLGVYENTLYANELANNQAQFCIEILFRAGFPFDSIWALPVDTNMGRVSMCSTDGTPQAMLSRRAAAHLPQDVIQLNGSSPGTNLYVSPFASALVPLVQNGTIRMGGCQAIRTNGGHSANFSTRMVRTNTDQAMVANGAPCPAIHFASLMPNSTILKGVEWKQNDVTFNNAPAGFQSLTRIDGNTNQQNVNGVMLSEQARNFRNLFSPAEIPFTNDEVLLIADATQRLNQNLVSYRSINNSETVVASARLGSGLLTEDYRNSITPSLADYNSWQMNQALGSVRLAEALHMLVKAFSLGLIRSATITIDTNDWHGDLTNVNLQDANYNPENTRYARYARYVSNALAKAYTLAQSLPNPHVPGKTVAEGLVTQMTSEFSRTLMHRDCNNHDDGGSNFIGIIGPTTKNITGANWNAADGQTVSIDRVTGQLDINAPTYTTGSAYATLCASLGIPATEINRFTSDPAILALLRS